MAEPKIIFLDAINLDNLLVDGDTGQYSAELLKRRTVSTKLLKQCGFEPIPNYVETMDIKNSLDAYRLMKLKLHLTKSAVENYLQETNDMIVLLEEKLRFEKKNEMMEDFWEENLEETDNNDDKISLSNIYQHFRSWYRCNYNINCMNQTEFKEYLINKIPAYSPNDNMLRGYKIKFLEMDELIAI